MTATPRPNLQITERDLGVLGALRDARYLTAEQIAWIFWKDTRRERPEKAAYERLQLLRQARLIVSFAPAVQLVRGGGFGRAAQLHALGYGGAVTLSSATGVAVEEIPYLEAKTPAWQKLNHTAAIGRCYAALRARVERTSSIRLSGWIGDHMTVKAYKELQPDAAFWLSKGDTRVLCCLELDRERPVKTWRDKIAKYRDFTASGKVQSVYGPQTFFLLCVTTRPSFRDKLREATLDVVGQFSPRYLFATLEDMTPDRVGDSWFTLANQQHTLIRGGAGQGPGETPGQTVGQFVPA